MDWKRQLEQLLCDAQKHMQILCDSIEARLLKGHVRPGHIVLLVYLDEAQSLGNIRGDGWAKSLLDIFISAFVDVSRWFLLKKLFLVTLSTNSHVTTLAPPKYLYPSARVVGGPSSLRAPYTELPFDLLPTGQSFIRPNQFTLEDVTKLSFVVKFGRPL